MTLHDIIEKISMNSYTQYEIRVMLEEYLPIQRKAIEEAFQEGAEHFGGTMTLPLSHVYYDRKFSKDGSEPFLTEGLLAIPEEHIFHGLEDVHFRTESGHLCKVGYDPRLGDVYESKPWEFRVSLGDKVYLVDVSLVNNGETAEEAVKRLGLKPIGE